MLNNNKIKKDRLSLLSRNDNSLQKHNSLYSKIVRALRITLPLAALLIVVIVLSWNNADVTIQTIQETENHTPSIGQNELIDPKFETRDKNGNPFTVTASKAVSDENNADLIQMDKPLADMMLKDGSWIAIKSMKGTYWQEDQKLSLSGNVRIYHDLGYEIQSEELNIDINEEKAYTSQDIIGQGPAGTLYAKSMNADIKTGNLIFKGPAKLVLYNAITIPQPQ